MSTLILEHVPVTELPAAWQAQLHAQLHARPAARVTVRIEQEAAPDEVATMTDNPLFGLWRDHPDVQDVEGYVRKLRRPRFNRDGSRDGNRDDSSNEG